MGLIRGGSLENAIVLTDDGVMNGPLRFPDEFGRHKALDLIGDLALADCRCWRVLKPTKPATPCIPSSSAAFWTIPRSGPSPPAKPSAPQVTLPDRPCSRPSC